LEVDFYVDPAPLTKEEEFAISNFIKLDKHRKQHSNLLKRKNSCPKKNIFLSTSNFLLNLFIFVFRNFPKVIFSQKPAKLNSCLSRSGIQQLFPSKENH